MKIKTNKKHKKCLLMFVKVIKFKKEKNIVKLVKGLNGDCLLFWVKLDQIKIKTKQQYRLLKSFIILMFLYWLKKIKLFWIWFAKHLLNKSKIQ